MDLNTILGFIELHSALAALTSCAVGEKETKEGCAIVVNLLVSEA